MTTTLLIVFAVGLLSIIVLLYMFTSKKNTLYWYMALGIILVRIITIYHIYDYVSDSVTDLGSGLGIMLIFFVYFINSICALISAIVIKITVKNTKTNGKIKSIIFLIITSVIYLLLLLLFAVYIPKISEDNTNKSISNNVITYLKNKFGDDGFKIESIEDDYSYDGFAVAHQDGYEVYVTSDSIDGTFVFNTDFDGNYSYEAFCSESFLTSYYEKKFDYSEERLEYVLPNHTSAVELEICDIDIPRNFGHIPTFDELIELEAIEELEVRIPKESIDKYKNDIDARMEYLKEEMSALIEYLNISKDFKCEYSGSRLFNYNVERKGNVLIVTGDDNFNDNIYQVNEYRVYIN